MAVEYIGTCNSCGKVARTWPPAATITRITMDLKRMSWTVKHRGGHSAVNIYCPDCIPE